MQRQCSAMYTFILLLLFCKNETTVFFVTPRFAISGNPIEMYQFCIEEMLFPKHTKDSSMKKSRNDVIVARLKSNSSSEAYNKLVCVFFERLLNMIPENKKTTEERIKITKKTTKYIIKSKKNKNLSLEKCRLSLMHMLIGCFASYYMEKYGKIVDLDLIYKLFVMLDIIFVGSQNDKNCSMLTKMIKEVWINKIVTDYIQKNHNQIDAENMRIITIDTDMDSYFERTKICQIFDIIDNEIEMKKFSNGYILLEPLFFLHSGMSFIFNIDKKKLHDINQLLENKELEMNFEKNYRLIKKLKSDDWRIIIRADYKKENLRKFIIAKFVDMDDDKLDINRTDFTHKDCATELCLICCIQEYFTRIYNSIINAFDTRIVCCNKDEYIKFDALQENIYDTLHKDICELSHNTDDQTIKPKPKNKKTKKCKKKNNEMCRKKDKTTRKREEDNVFVYESDPSSDNIKFTLQDIETNHPEDFENTNTYSDANNESTHESKTTIKGGTKHVDNTQNHATVAETKQKKKKRKKDRRNKKKIPDVVVEKESNEHFVIQFVQDTIDVTACSDNTHGVEIHKPQYQEKNNIKIEQVDNDLAQDNFETINVLTETSSTIEDTFKGEIMCKNNDEEHLQRTEIEKLKYKTTTNIHSIDMQLQSCYNNMNLKTETKKIIYKLEQVNSDKHSPVTYEKQLYDSFDSQYKITKSELENTVNVTINEIKKEKERNVQRNRTKNIRFCYHDVDF